MPKKLAIVGLALFVVVAGYSFISKESDDTKPSKQGGNGRQEAGLSKEEISKYTIDNQSSIYFVVNKKRSLPSSFVPQNLVTLGNEQLRSDVAPALNSLIEAARNDGINLRVLSGYRSYDNQALVYNNYVRADGRQKADTYSARPGHSEHQLGLAADLGTGTCDLQVCFGDTKGGKWLAQNAYKYGFIIRYPEGKQDLTGYQYEPWHLRYTSDGLAQKIYKSGKTMEQFFGLPPAVSY